MSIHKQKIHKQKTPSSISKKIGRSVDRGYLGAGKKPANEFFKTRLFRQLEKIIVLHPLESQLNDLKKEGEFCPIAYDFLNGLADPDQRIFFEYTYAKIVDNYRVWKDKPNRFSANRMIAYL